MYFIGAKFSPRTSLDSRFNNSSLSFIQFFIKLKSIEMLAWQITKYDKCIIINNNRWIMRKHVWAWEIAYVV